MKILYVSMDNTNYGGPDGASRSHEVLVAEEMARRGHEILLLAERQPNWTSSSPQPKNLDFRSVPVNKADPRLTAAIARTLPGDFDAAFASSVSGAPLLSAWKKAHTEAPAVKNKRVVATALDVPVWRIRAGPGTMGWYESWRPWFDGLCEMDIIIANTHQTVEDLATVAQMYAHKAPLPRTEVVYYGIATETCDAAEPQQLPIPGDAEGVPESWAITVHRLVPYKGADLGIAAISILEEKTRPGFIIVGDGAEAPHLWDFASLAPTNVVMPGPVSDEVKFGLIKGATVGLFLAFNPSIPAQFPMECVYAGKPCIVSKMDINVERFGDHGVRYVNPFNTAEVAAVLEQEIKHARSPEWARQVEKHREWIRENRSFASHAREVLDVLEAKDAAP